MFRRFVMLASWLTAILCTILLLNFTASNPTGRRYSSDEPLTTGQGTSQQLGQSGEKILSQDLRLPNNNDAGQRQLLCNSTFTYSTFIPPNCLVYIPLSTAPYEKMVRTRRPDFIGETLMAESKNVRSLTVNTPSFYELRDYATGARALHRPLWVFTRVDTRVDAEYYDLVRSTGGDIVPYFAVPGYADPIDRAAGIVLAGSLSLFVLSGVWEMGAFSLHRRPARVNRRKRGMPAPVPVMPEAPAPKAKTLPETSAMRRAMRGTQATEEFLKQSNETARSVIDRPDVRNDDG